MSHPTVKEGCSVKMLIIMKLMMGDKMTLDYKLIKGSKHITNNWSGGTTTELGIYPENSSYQDRNFTWRISSATVDLEQSIFTSLPDYNRIIMVLKGNLVLNHKGQHAATLNEFEQYEFDGGINTESFGKVTDYNLMMRKGACVGQIEVIKLDPKSIFTTAFKEFKKEQYSERIDVYYNINGEVKLSINESNTILLENKDILLVNRKNEKQKMIFKCYNNCEKDAIIVRSCVIFNNKI